MDKKIPYDIFMSAKRVAQACNPFYSKRNSVKKQIEKLTAEYNAYDTQITSLEAGIKALTGFRVEDIVKKVIEPKLDAFGKPVIKEGKPVKVTKYVPTEIVHYDKEAKQYVVTVEDEASNNCQPVVDTDEEPDSITTGTPEFE